MQVRYLLRISKLPDESNGRFECLKNRQSKTVMSIQPGFAVRAFSDWQVLPQTDFYTMLKFAMKRGRSYRLEEEAKNFYSY